MHIIVRKKTDSDHGDLLNHLLTSEKWNTTILDTSHMQLSIKSKDMKLLQNVLSGHHTEFFPPDTRTSIAGYPKKELKISRQKKVRKKFEKRPNFKV